MSEQAWAEMLRMCNTETFESVFKLGKRLGAGAGGTVYLGTHLGTGEMSAIKNIDLAGGGTKKVVRGEIITSFKFDTFHDITNKTHIHPYRSTF